MTQHRHPSSFRDPSGYVFTEAGAVYRHINPAYFNEYNAIKSAGLYDTLISKGLLISHEEVEANSERILLKAETIPFFSYPYEWSFSQYKHAALHTLKLQRFCLLQGFSLKDATAFNITFHNGGPVFVDTLSIEKYTEDTPWRAYRQFLMHFLAPLVLAKYYGNDMLQILRQYIDGMPLQKVVQLLPFKARFSPLLYTSLFLTAKYDTQYEGDKKTGSKAISLSKEKQLKILDALYDYISNLECRENTEWQDYYNTTNYTDSAFTFKKDIITRWATKTGAQRIIDHGGNDGTFTREVAANANLVLCTDIDANAVNANYLKVLAEKEKNILPLVSNLLEPSPAIGFNNTERDALKDRMINAKFDLSMALALIHHISLTGNVPFDASAKYFASLSPYLIIEFPDREDSWVTFLLDSKREFKEHFSYYNLDNFEKAYTECFSIEDKIAIPGTHRTLYLLKRH
ncbi:class I SAM-dependent methyltransferase [Flavobacterium sp. RHBU_3]|uniref:class I SAM-dependent methyltransferase n=1 Tax=Flavobacterium sp. RHBU_3 TaxID=3391184 RepID=UPI003984C864